MAILDSYINRLKDLRGGSTPKATAPSSTPMMTPAAPKPSSAPVASNPGATSPVSTPQQPPKPSPAATSYVQNLNAPIGLTQNDVTANLAKAGFSTAGGAAQAPAPQAPVDPKTAYLTKLRELMTPSEAETTASKGLADLNSEIFTTKFEGTEKANELFDKQGMLKGGAIEASNRSGMRTNQELARLATRQNAAANTLQALTGERTGKLEGAKPVQLGNDFFDPITGEKLYVDPKANEAFNLSEGQTRYEFNEKTGKYEVSASAPKTTAGGGLDNASLMQFVTNPQLLNSLSPGKKSEVILAMAKAGINVPNANADTLSAYQLADELSNMDVGAITGAGQNPFNALGLSNASTINKYKQLKSVLALENRAKLKGSGAISDFEARTLDAASSALGRNLSNEEFEKELNKVKGALGTAAGMSMPVSVTDPKTGVAKEGFASRAEIDDAIRQGFSVEYI